MPDQACTWPNPLSLQVVSRLHALPVGSDVKLPIDRKLLTIIHLAYATSGAYPGEGDWLYVPADEELDTPALHVRILQRKWVLVGINVVKLMFVVADAS